jgi:hypothetical protein
VHRRGTHKKTQLCVCVFLKFGVGPAQLGGTVGDIESAPFIEAMRQFQFRVGHENFALIHVSLVPDMHGEQKTKPTQTTVHALRGLGLLPDLVSQSQISFLDPKRFYNMWISSFFFVFADRLPLTYPSTTPNCYEREDFHVLSCILRTSVRGT